MIKFVCFFLLLVSFSSVYGHDCEGRDGRDGRDGTDGKNGKDGKNGLNGTDGNDGKDGKNGIDGRDGRDGKDAIRNWKQCAYKNVNDGKDNGMIRECDFKKHRVNTYLKVVVATSMRIYNCNDCCKRWFVTINGAECGNPAAIDGVVYMRYGNGDKLQNLHRSRVIRGACKVPSKGTIKVALNVGNCASYGNADAYTGWNSVTNIYIEEIDPPQA